MKRIIIGLMCLAMLLCVALSASAEPVVTHGGYTAYLRENNYLYLQTPVKTMWLETPISDIVEISDTLLYCIDQEGRLMSIELDGTESKFIAMQPTQEQIDAVRNTPRFKLEGTLLTLNNNAPVDTALSTTAIFASANTDTLFWIETDATGATTLKSLLLTEQNAMTQVLGAGVTSPLSLIATDETVTMVAADHTVTVVSLLDRSRNTYPAASELTTHAVAIGGQLIRYTYDSETGKYATEANIQTLSALPLTTEAPTYAAGLPVVTATPTVTPVVTTPRPTNTPRPTTSSSSSSSTTSSSAVLSKGDRGSEVRKMQKRLSELGYPVGVVDGIWGDDTQLAVNLFQCAIGYSERNYATSGMLNKLYGKNAPVYDPYAPLKEGDRGTDVLIMQNTLLLMGYDPGKLDGIYGKNTVAAVSVFQLVAGFEVTGEADADTLKLLYSPECPPNPGVHPSTTPEPGESTPTNITKVSVQGNTSSPKVGDKLTVKVEPAGATVTYAWYRAGSTEVIATTATYTVQRTDVGKSLYCIVTGIGDYTGQLITTVSAPATRTDLN